MRIIRSRPSVQVAAIAMTWLLIPANALAITQSQHDKEVDDLNHSISQAHEQEIDQQDLLDLLLLQQQTTQTDIEQSEQDLTNTQNALQQIQEDLATTTTDIETQSAIVSTILQELYKQQRLPLFVQFLEYDSFSTFLDHHKATTSLEADAANALNELNTLQETQTEQQTELQQTLHEQTVQQSDLRAQQTHLATQQESQQQLLAETHTSLASLQQRLADIQNRIITQPPPTPPVLPTPTPPSTTPPTIPPAQQGSFRWPFTDAFIARQGIYITARFMDPAYKAIIGIDHPAIDIAAPQNTPVVAVMDGTVSRIYRSASPTGYCAVYVKHDNGLTTAYGHTHSFSVSPGQRVRAGDILALSGGTPNTTCAGTTTGSHLHFETYNAAGQHIDPLPFFTQR